MPYYIIFSIIPFNLMLSVVVTIFTALVHKRLKYLYDMIGRKYNEKTVEENNLDEVANDSISSEEINE